MLEDESGVKKRKLIRNKKKLWEWKDKKMTTGRERERDC